MTSFESSFFLEGSQISMPSLERRHSTNARGVLSDVEGRISEVA
jgi:hypothetical protein